MRAIALLSMGLLVSVGLQAQPMGDAPQPVLQQQERTGLAEPARVLRHGLETITGYMEENRASDPRQLRGFLEREIVPYFDFGRMSRWAAGPVGRHFSPPQQERFTRLLKERFMGAMVEQLSGFQHSRLEYLRPRGNPMAGDVVLGVRVYSANAYPVQLDFRLYRSRDGWKVYDVVANGSSAVAHYRQEFAMLARRYGVEGLLARLER
ncbi:MAG: MlaC/ttg2D family ABC transporter substrate-binding protein [Pseudomonadota bacterium]